MIDEQKGVSTLKISIQLLLTSYALAKIFLKLSANNSPVVKAAKISAIGSA